MFLVHVTGRSASAQTWDGPFDWSACVEADPACTNQQLFTEFAHASLIPTGLYRGKVLMWQRHIQYTAGGTPPCEALNESLCFIFDPLSPSNLIRLKTAVPSDILCAGQSWDPFGRLVVVGGNRSAQPSLDNAYVFHPAALSAPQGSGCGLKILGRAWMALPDMKESRFYPTIIGLTKQTLEYNASSTWCNSIFGGGHLILGGPYTSTPHTPGVDMFELLPFGVWQWACAIDATAPSSVAGTDDYSRRAHLSDPNPTVPPTGLLDSYPRAFQLSNGDVLVAHDVDTVSTSGTVANTALEHYVVRFNQSGSSKTQFWRGLVNTSHPGSNADRNYGNAVLLHKLNQLDRVLVFGGKQVVPINPPVDYQPVKSVQEFVPESAPTTAGSTVEGQWVPKVDLLVPREYGNAVVLPDGTIFIVGGRSNVSPEQPIAQPEIYDPGTFRTDPGSRVPMPPPNTVYTSGTPPIAIGPTQRLYHSTALLLPDGSVFVAGGESPVTQPSGFAPGPYSGEIFKPAYMPESTGYDMPYIGSVASEQPMSTTSQTNAFDITVENIPTNTFNVVGVVLTRPGAVTHFFDNDQRYIELVKIGESQDESTLTLTVNSPLEKLGPPGWYLLWVIVTKGGHTQRLPTQAAFVRFY